MNQPALIDIRNAAKRIAAARRIAITTHARADGDALGCVAAMQRVMRLQGKQATALIHEPPSPRYEFVNDLERLSIWESSNSPEVLARESRSAAEILSESDLLVVLDTCAAVQLGDVAEAIRSAALPKLAIDHHITRDEIVDEAWVDESAGACALLVLRLCEEARWPLDATTATLLFVGLATDTGWFRFSNADREVFAAGARLVAAGARPNELYERLYLSEILPRVRLMGEVMASFELFAGDRLAVVKVTGEMLSRCGATRPMTEEIMNEPMRLASVVACAMFVEPEGREPVRVSLRSKRDVDVAALAARWGGGGHARAAGAKVSGDFAVATKEVVAALVKELEATGPARTSATKS